MFAEPKLNKTKLDILICWFVFVYLKKCKSSVLLYLYKCQNNEISQLYLLYNVLRNENIITSKKET